MSIWFHVIFPDFKYCGALRVFAVFFTFEPHSIVAAPKLIVKLIDSLNILSS